MFIVAVPVILVGIFSRGLSNMGKTNEAFFKVAKNISALSDHPKYQLGCVIVDHHRIISSGCNSYTKCHPLQSKIDSQRFGCYCRGCVHAETAALLPLIRDNVDLSKAAIYVYRGHKDGTDACARPCPGCESLIRSCGIRDIYYTSEDGYVKEKW